MEELTKLMETHADHNSKLRQENGALANKLTVLLEQYEEREKTIGNKTHELQLQLKLVEAQFAKAKIEKAGREKSSSKVTQTSNENSLPCRTKRRFHERAPRISQDFARFQRAAGFSLRSAPSVK